MYTVLYSILPTPCNSPNCDGSLPCLCRHHRPPHGVHPLQRQQCTSAAEHAADPVPVPTVKAMHDHQLKDIRCGPVGDVYAVCAAV